MGKHPPRELSYNILWYEIFKDERWLDNVTTNNAHPGLLGQNLDRCSPERGGRITLLLHNWQDNQSKRLFFESLRHYKELESGYEVDIGKLRLNIAVIRGIPYMESWPPEGSEYCFWTDINRKLRTIKAKDVTSDDIPHFQYFPERFRVSLSFVTQAKKHGIQYVFSQVKVYYIK